MSPSTGASPVTVAPTVEVRVGGAPLPATATRLLASVRVARVLSQPAQCELSLVAEPELAVGDEPPFGLVIGAGLGIAVTGDRGSLFEGEITGREWSLAEDGAVELRIRAYDLLHRLRKHHEVLARTDVSAADLAGELAASIGLGSRCEDDGGPRWPVLVQHRHDDLELLQEVAGAAGLWFGVDGGDLVLHRLSGTGETIEVGLRRELLAARFADSAEPAGRRIRATGWDPVQAAGLEAAAADPATDPRPANDPGAVGGDGVRWLVDRPGPSAEHLEAAARAELDRLVARESTITGVAVGDARLRPGRRLKVADAPASAGQDFVLTETVHTLDARGYRTELSSLPPPRPEPRWAQPPAAVTLGEVLSADDPGNRGRVRLALPAYGGIETDWREVVSVGAGAGKGLTVVPDQGDRVLVLLPGGDPAAAVVVGGLYNDDAAPADFGIDGGSVRRWSLRTPGGQAVLLDDGGRRLALADEGGSSIELAPGKVTIFAAADLAIEAPGHTLTLRANQIDLVQATSGESRSVLGGGA